MGLLIAFLLASASTLAAGEIPEQWRAALNRVSADSVRGHVSFLASDLLEGRDTPSPGLEIAAEYIAAQFRRAGLEPIGDDGHFQVAEWELRRSDKDRLSLSLHSGDRIIRVAGNHLAANAQRAVLVDDSEVTVTALDKAAGLKPEKVDGKVVAVVVPETGENNRRQRSAVTAYSRFTRAMAKRTPALILLVDPSALLAGEVGRAQLVDPGNPPEAALPTIVVTDPIAADVFSDSTEIRISANCGEPIVEPVRLKNVIGILRGSDPTLAGGAVLVTAHYDHVGVSGGGDGDRIYNGANDDASGTAAVMEVARALASLERRPKRSIVFIAFFGEEKGMLGAGYYAKHPVFPLAETAANINIEQVGRTDSSEGEQIRNATVTGFDYSEVPAILAEAGARTGIEVYKHEKNSSRFFDLSDNIRLAERGVPAHTVATTFLFPDYHGVGDHWDKMDYANMAAVTRMIALGALLIAERDTAPAWNKNSSGARPFLKARQKPAGETR